MLLKLKKLGLTAVFILAIYQTQAQGIESIMFNTPEYKIANSLYNKITIIDIRHDTTKLGYIQKGMANRLAKVVTAQPLPTQFNNLLSALTDGSAQSGELLLLLRQLNFSEITTTYSEKGYFGFGANMYVKKDSTYLPLNTIDTIAIVSAMDVTNKNLRNGSAIMADFIAQSLVLIPDSTRAYKYDELLNYEELTKKKIKLYNTTAYTDGYYSTYKAFSNQIPDGQIALEDKSKGIKPGNIKMLMENGSLKKIKPEAIYAFVLDGKPYISTSFGFYPVIKYNNDFFFSGRLSNTMNNNNAIVMGVMFGAIGGFIALSASNNHDRPYDVKIQYTTGDFIRLRLSDPGLSN